MGMTTEALPIQDFSESYYILPTHEYRTYSGDVVGADEGVMRTLRQLVGEYPMVRADSGHYWLRTEFGIPAGTIAVPEDVEFDELTGVLIAKEHTARHLLQLDAVDSPRRGRV